MELIYFNPIKSSKEVKFEFPEKFTPEEGGIRFSPEWEGEDQEILNYNFKTVQEKWFCTGGLIILNKTMFLYGYGNSHSYPDTIQILGYFSKCSETDKSVKILANDGWNEKCN